MNEQDQIKALAELDGNWIDLNASMVHYKNYFTYDAIIPLIQKQWKSTDTQEGVEWQLVFWKSLPDSECMLFDLPSQLSEALLRATAKWKE